MPEKFDFPNALYYSYADYKEKSLQKRRFKHSELSALINKLKNKDIFSVNKAGKSFEGRDIFLITAGTGKTKVLLWSQMHGDEATATMAIFDIFNFLKADDSLNEIRTQLLKNLTIYFIPMLNPDGAERFQRRTAQNIDMNRDALRFQTLEAKILKKTIDEIKPDFGYNLHDQTTRYSVGYTSCSAAISLLAPSTDFQKSINPVRKNAIKLATSFYNAVSKIIPGHIAKYDDEFEPRAFGDNVQKWGVSTILVESGGWKNDPEKQLLRELNFIGILCSLNSISDESFKKESEEIYNCIPFNKERIFDVLLRNLEIPGHKTKVDIGINHYEKNCNNNSNFYYSSILEDIGDLSNYFGYEDVDLSGHHIEAGKTYEQKFNSFEEIKNLDFNKLHRKGYTEVILGLSLPSQGSTEVKDDFTNLPINICLKDKKTENKIEIGVIPNLVVKKNDIPKYIIVNGFVCDVEDSNGYVPNGLVFRA